MIIIGILGAFMLNSWNESRKEEARLISIHRNKLTTINEEIKYLNAQNQQLSGLRDTTLIAWRIIEDNDEISTNFKQ